MLDDVPEAPEIEWDSYDPFFHEAYRENYVLLYIPHRVRVNGEEKDLILQTFIEMCGNSCDCNDRILEEFGNSTVPGWVLASKKVIPGSRNKNYETQKNMVVEKQGFRMLHVFEAVVLNLMVFAFTTERLYGEAPLTFTRCIEKMNMIDWEGVAREYYFAVGSFDLSLKCRFAEPYGTNFYGIAVLREKF